MLIGKQTGANGTSRNAARQHGGLGTGAVAMAEAQIGPDKFLKFR